MKQLSTRLILGLLLSFTTATLSFANPEETKSVEELKTCQSLLTGSQPAASDSEDEESPQSKKSLIAAPIVDSITLDGKRFYFSDIFFHSHEPFVIMYFS